jgi:hypothetical protein
VDHLVRVPRVRHLRGRPRSAADDGRRLRWRAGHSAAQRGRGVLAACQYGRDPGRNNALAVHRNRVCAGTDP